MNDVIAIPMQVSDTEYILVVALSSDSLDRVRNYDPCELPLHRMGDPFNRLKCREVHITHYTEEDSLEVLRLVNVEHNSKAAIRLLTRGWKYRPDMGDNDLPPYTMKPVN